MFRNFEQVFCCGGGTKLEYKEKIIEMIESIDDVWILFKIFTFVKAWIT